MTKKTTVKEAVKEIKKEEKQIDAKKEFLEKERDIKRKERALTKKEGRYTFVKTFNTTIVGALTFVAGLFWRDLINEALDFLPRLYGFFGTMISTLLLTGLFVVVIVRLDKRSRKAQDAFEKDKKKVDDDKLKLEQEKLDLEQKKLDEKKEELKK